MCFSPLEPSEDIVFQHVPSASSVASFFTFLLLIPWLLSIQKHCRPFFFYLLFSFHPSIPTLYLHLSIYLPILFFVTLHPSISTCWIRTDSVQPHRVSIIAICYYGNDAVLVWAVQRGSEKFWFWTRLLFSSPPPQLPVDTQTVVSMYSRRRMQRCRWKLNGACQVLAGVNNTLTGIWIIRCFWNYQIIGGRNEFSEFISSCKCCFNTCKHRSRGADQEVGLMGFCVDSKTSSAVCNPVGLLGDVFFSH